MSSLNGDSLSVLRWVNKAIKLILAWKNTKTMIQKVGTVECFVFVKESRSKCI